MKKTLSFLGVLLIAVMWSATGSSAEKYISGNIGISWFNDADIDWLYLEAGETDRASLDFGSGITVLGAIGCDYGALRIEGELGYQKNDIESLTYTWTDSPWDEGESYDFSGDVSVTSLMANTYYDIDLGGIELYLTAGVGVARISFDDIDYNYNPDQDDPAFPRGWMDDDDLFNSCETTLAYQIGAGFGVPVSEKITIDARYRYFATTDFTLDDWGNGNIESHLALLGLRINL